ncbi:hypothetical protein AB6N24_08815 [Cellulomonas sp. 179-A 4D5 NHS]|uniref:hypothetical protein n=1 Tax=Cellulomonas sp. 179-A 4D5 NHS TaxID=3142378 RepID=UPI0039A2B04C
MSTNDTEPSPWTRPSFITAAIVVAIVVMLGAALAIRALTNDDANAAPPEPTASASASAEPSPTSDDEAAGTDASICGLEGVETTGTVTMAPAGEWAFQGTTAYPTSPEFGPGQADTTGARFCFQHSPEGALFMAANAVVQASDPATASAWAQEVLAQGQFYDQLLSELGTPSPESNSRVNIVGFRLLAYDGKTARVDIALRGTFDAQTATVSGVYELVWQSGDWKISSDVQEPLNVAVIPDLAGYVSWGA